MFKNHLADVVSDGKTMACASQPGGPPSLMLFVAEGAAESFLAKFMGPSFRVVPMVICDAPSPEAFGAEGAEGALLAGWVAVADNTFFVNQHDAMMLWAHEHECIDHIKQLSLEGGRPHLVVIFGRQMVVGGPVLH